MKKKVESSEDEVENKSDPAEDNTENEDEDSESPSKAKSESVLEAAETEVKVLTRKEKMELLKRQKYEAELASRGPGGVGGTSSGGAAGDQFSLSQQTSKVSSQNLENAVDIKVRHCRQTICINHYDRVHE